jgi:hypothetical protein
VSKEHFYGSFSIQEADSVGKKFKAKCHANWGYENYLTVGKVYEITIAERILPVSPLCTYVDDKGAEGSAHLTRFTKIEEIKDEHTKHSRRSS